MTLPNGLHSSTFHAHAIGMSESPRSVGRGRHWSTHMRGRLRIVCGILLCRVVSERDLYYVNEGSCMDGPQK